MVDIRKISLISAAVMALYTSNSSFANNPDDVEALAEKFVASAVMLPPMTTEPDDIGFKNNLIAQDKAAEEQIAYNNSWTKYAKDFGISTAQYLGNKFWDGAVSTASYAAAWNLNYYGVEILEEVTAYTAYAGATLVAGPAVGAGVYNVTKGTIKVARYVLPGFEHYIAGTYAPLTKAVIVDPAIKYGL